MTRLTALIAVGILAAAIPQDCGASDWSFKRSWFSHQPVPGQPLPKQRSASRPALPQVGPGFAVRSSYRYNIYRIQNGSSFDTTIYRQFSAHGTPY